jgi:CubicO group peptidase (beta-lactamase class C family)
MYATRRSLIRLGTAGMLLPAASWALAKDRKSSFEQWRIDFEKSVPIRMEAAKVVGASVAITAPGNAVRYAASFGFADLKTQRKLTVDTPMHLASVSKLFTASALVQLFERRGHDLHADVNEFIDFSVVNPHHKRQRITPHQLVTHTSSISDRGYGDVSSPGDPRQSLHNFLKNYLEKGGRDYDPDKSYRQEQPGDRWDYSNVGAALGGYVVESVSGQSFASYVEDNVLAPLGIHDAHWYLREFDPEVLAKPYRLKNGDYLELPQEGYPDVPAGMLRCSVSNLARSLQAMLGQETGAKAILSDHAVKEMLRRQVDRQIHSYQGLGWTREKTALHPVVGHTGSDNGASNMVALTKDQTQAVALLMNIDGTRKTDEFRASIVDDLLVGAKLAR